MDVLSMHYYPTLDPWVTWPVLVASVVFYLGGTWLLKAVTAKSPVLEARPLMMVYNAVQVCRSCTRIVRTQTG